MRLNSDGVSPVPRMLLLSEIQLYAAFQVGLDAPVLVAAGDRISYQDGGLVVTRSSGERYTNPIRDSYWICR
ncbi:hypothetical protein ACFZAU_40355 [Streptomyces sp. NPDC008238]